MNTHYVGPCKQRFPRLLSEEDEEKLDVLVVEATVCYERGRIANIEFGRVLRKLKKVVKRKFGHGYWAYYYALKFPNVPARTARTYMRLAKTRGLPAQSG